MGLPLLLVLPTGRMLLPLRSSGLTGVRSCIVICRMGRVVGLGACLEVTLVLSLHRLLLQWRCMRGADSFSMGHSTRVRMSPVLRRGSAKVPLLVGMLISCVSVWLIGELRSRVTPGDLSSHGSLSEKNVGFYCHKCSFLPSGHSVVEEGEWSFSFTFFYRYIYWVILRLVDSLLANPHYGSSSILYLAACSITRKGESFGQLGP